MTATIHVCRNPLCCSPYPAGEKCCPCCGLHTRPNGGYRFREAPGRVRLYRDRGEWRATMRPAKGQQCIHADGYTAEAAFWRLISLVHHKHRALARSYLEKYPGQ